MLLKPLFTEKETEALRGEVILPSHIARKLNSGHVLCNLPTQRVEQS